MNKIYKFKFRFEYGAGGCLWPFDKFTANKFNSPADAVVTDLNNQVLYDPLKKLPISKNTLERIEHIDKLYYSYLNQDNPMETFITDKNNFLNLGIDLFNTLKQELGENYEIIWAFDI